MSRLNSIKNPNQNFYVLDLAKSVKENRLTKLTFAIIFLIVGLFGLSFSLYMLIQFKQSQNFWYVISGFGFLASIFLSRKPKNVRTLYQSSKLSAEINIMDYFWLEHACKKYPIIQTDTKTLLTRSNKISFTELENLWIKIGESEKKLTDKSFKQKLQLSKSRSLDIQGLKSNILKICNGD